MTIFIGCKLCWALPYFFIIDQFVEGLLSAWVNLFCLPWHSVVGILSILTSGIYIIVFIIFVCHNMLIISVCNQVRNQIKNGN